jgi:flagellar biosynthesis/type III secretory pathway protein FliH
MATVMKKQFTPDPASGPSSDRPGFLASNARCRPPEQQFQLNPQVNRQIRELEEKVLQQLRGKAARIEHEAYEQGFAQGEKDGLETGRKKLEVVLRQMGALLAEIDGRRETLFRQYEEGLVDFALGVIKKIVRREAEQGPGIIKDTLRAAFRQVEENRRTVLHLNPADYKYLLAHPRRLPFVLGDRERIKILEDDTLTATDYGVIDATVEGQFEHLVEEVVWKSRSAPSEKGES